MNEWTNEGLDWNQGAFPPWSWSKLTHVRGRTGCTGTKLSFWTISSREGFETDQCLRPEQSEGGSKNPAGGDWGSSEGWALSEQLPGSRSRGRGWEGSAQEGVPGAWLVNLSAAQQHSKGAFNVCPLRIFSQISFSASLSPRYSPHRVLWNLQMQGALTSDS